MSEVPERDKEDRRLSRNVSAAFREQLDEVMELLGDLPSLENLPPEFSEEQRRELSRVLVPALTTIYLASATGLAQSTPIGIDVGEMGITAASWAESYGFNLVSGINATTRRALQQQIATYFRDDLTLGQLRTNLQSTFGPVRADMIATTEITRASVQGELATVEELRRQGAEMVGTWQTSVDEQVCEICAPLQGTKQGIDWTDPPPAHVRCRCWINWQFVGAQ